MPRAAFALALLALPVGAAACGGSSGRSGSSSTTTPSGAASATAVGDAVRKTVAAGTEHVDLAVKVAAGGQNVTLTGSGDFDTPNRRGSMHASFSLSGTHTSLDEVQAGTAIYLRSPLFSAFLPAGKTWLKLDLAKAASTLGIDASALTAQDPAAALAQLQAITGLKRLGKATVGGVETTHYEGRVDVAKLPASAAQALKASGTKIAPLDVWVGADGYVHRIEVTTSAASSGQTVKTALTMTLSDFGETVKASVPAASSTLDASNVSIPGLGG